MTDDTQNPKVESGNSKIEKGNPDSGIRNSESPAGSAVLIEEPPAENQDQSAIPDPSTVPASSHKPSITFPLLLEVGCEEIPARFLRDAEKALGSKVLERLKAYLLLPEGTQHTGRRKPRQEIQTYSTPRRLIVYVPKVLARQRDVEVEVVGPPVKVGVDAQGRYTRAAESFAEKNSVSVAELIRTTTPKGEYLAVRKSNVGRPALELLGVMLPNVILSLNFPKSMYWTEKLAPRFVRPIRWIVALLGEGKRATTIDFSILGVKAGNFTFGHRAQSTKPITVNGFKHYTSKLSQAFVEIDYSKRKERVLAAASAVDAATGKIVADEWLVDWIANSTEWPLPMLGSFDARFLHLPREILITVMRDHQRYFAVEDVGPSGARPDGEARLAPHFVALLNMASDEQGLIRQGHQRVLTARFRDAEFFWAADQKIPLRDRFPLLEKVTYQAKLGSYADKVRRMERVGQAIGYGLINQRQITEAGLQNVKRAILLSKCDLTTQMVHEFTELQGVVGGLYADFQGENIEISKAVYEHYKPQGPDDECPSNLVGAIVALADKIDGVASGFVAGVVPKGSSDTFGLRRQGNGIVRILVDKGISTNARPLVLIVLDQLSYGDATLQTHTTKANALADDIVSFIRERVGFYLESVEGLEYDIVRAALGAHEASWNLLENDPLGIVERSRALMKARATDGFVKLCGAAKRIRNILSKSADSPDSLGWYFEESLFNSEEEKRLGQATQEVESAAQSLARNGQYVAAFAEITKLADPIGSFFDAVLVMAEESRIRSNRLRLLNRLNRVFSAIADLSQIVVE